MFFDARLYFHGLLWTVAFFVLSCAQAHASLAGISPDSIGMPIDHIRISGNQRTLEAFIFKTTGLHSGQIITIPMLTAAQQELRDTDLFRQISFQTERLENGELHLHLILEEKKYWIVLPRVSRNSDGDVKAGFRLRMYNLQGTDQTLQVLIQQEEEDDGDDSEQLRIRYDLPLLDQPYKLRWRLNKEISNVEFENFDNIEKIDLLSMSVSRDWYLDRFDIPVTVETGITLEQRRLDEPYPDDVEAREAGKFNRIRLELILDDLHREKYRRYGSYHSIGIASGLYGLDSDYESTIVQLQTMRFIRLSRYDNFNYRVELAATNDSPFDYRNYSIGGGSNVRGLESVDERGDARIFSNMEFVFAYKKHPGLRHTLFLDVGNIYDDLEDIDLTDLRYTVGTGFRWKIESFVKTDLFLDYGYDVEDSAGKLYGGTSLAF